MTMRLSIISLAGIARTLVAVGTSSEANMFFTTAAAAPRSTCASSPSAFGVAGLASASLGLAGVTSVLAAGGCVTAGGGRLLAGGRFGLRLGGFGLGGRLLRLGGGAVACGGLRRGRGAWFARRGRGRRPS